MRCITLSQQSNNCSRLDGTDVGETALRPSQKVLMQAQQALLNAEIDQQRKSLEGPQSYRIPCKSNGITDGEQRSSGHSCSCCRSSKQQAPDFNRKTAQEAVSWMKPRVFRLIRW
ncbi:MAG: hypothetical protein ACLRP3_12910 [Escherichia sp.]